MFQLSPVTTNIDFGTTGLTLRGVGRIRLFSVTICVTRFRLNRCSGVNGRYMSSSPRMDFSIVSNLPTNFSDSSDVDLMTRGMEAGPSPATYQFGRTCTAIHWLKSRRHGHAQYSYSTSEFQKRPNVGSSSPLFKSSDMPSKIPGLVALYDIRPGNGVGLFLQSRSPHGALVETTHVTEFEYHFPCTRNGIHLYYVMSPGKMIFAVLEL